MKAVEIIRCAIEDEIRSGTLLPGDQIDEAELSAPLAALAATPKTVTFDVQNMTCELCPITVKKSLEKVSGVSAVKIDFNHKTATVSYGFDKAQPEALTKATTNAGYPSTLRK